MPAKRHQIAEWLAEGKSQGATHTIVVCDTFDHEDYPVHVMPSEKVQERINDIEKLSMQRLMEVYNHSIDHESQLAEHRAYHI
jgi:hypothetical protein